MLSFAYRKIPTGERWFPNTPSQIHIGVWDGGASKSQGVSSWAGGPIKWGNQARFSATYKSIEIQCYNDKDMPVKSWPPQPEGASIDFPAGKEIVSGNAISITDRNGRVVSDDEEDERVRFQNSALTTTMSIASAIFFLWAFFV
jgi:hypothetical protein